MGAAAILLAVVGTLIAGPTPAQADPADEVPATVTVVPGRRLLVVTWTAPTIPAGPIDHYAATTSPAGGTCSVSALTCTITNLAATTSYTVGVKACYAPSSGSCSTETVSGSVMTGPPGAPAAPTVAFNGNPNAVTVSWVTPAVGAGIASYVVSATPSAGLTGTCQTLITVGTNTCGFAGLTSGTSYTFKVTANGVTNSAGSNGTTGSTGLSPASPASAAIVAGPPGAPLNVAAVRASDTSLTLSWSPPSTGAPVSGYTVTSAQSGVGVGDVSSSELSSCSTPAGCTFTGLTASRAYTFQVAANGVGGGSGSTSATSAAVIPGTPGTPGTPVVDLTSLGNVTVSWTAPSSGGTIVDYLVTPSGPGAAPSPATCTTVTTSCDFSGLASGQAYTFVVTANNAAGTAMSAPSDPVVSALPGQPAAVTVELGATAGTATVSWVQPPSSGVVSYFTVTPAIAGVPGAPCTAGPSATNCLLTGLTTTDPYTFVVTAVGDLGSTDSNATDALYLAVPHVPGTVTAALTSATAATVNWSAPVGTGGGPVVSYIVTPIGGPGTVPSSCLLPLATTCAITGLTAATPYTFRVTAVNGAGNSPNSTSASITTSAPNAPAQPTVVLGVSPGTATVTWTAPAGGPVTSYTVTAIPSGAGSTGSQTPNPCGASLVTLTCSFSGLSTTNSYTFVVRAINVVGGANSPASASVIPDQPGTPTAVAVALGAPGTATVTWGVPADGGAPASYSVAVTSVEDPTLPADCVVVGLAARTCTFTGLDITSSYAFTVTATNLSGSTAATATTAVTPNVPAVPTDVTVTLATAQTGALRVAWTPGTGGGAVAGYTVTVSSNGGAFVPPCGPVTVTYCDFTGLDPTRTYQFVVTAANAAGPASASITTGVVPNKPAVPTGVTVTLGTATPGVVTVGWTTPGGGVATGFTVTATPTTSGTTMQCLAGAGTNSCVFTGPTILNPTLAYTFVVTATNLAGSSDSAPTAAVTPDRPAGPTGLSVALGATPGNVTVGWTTPGGGLATGFTVTATPMTGVTPPVVCVAGAGANSCLFTGGTALSTSLSYTFVVRATNLSGFTDSDSFGPVTADEPAAPTAMTVTLAAGQTGALRVAWTPGVGGGAVANYTVTMTVNGGSAVSACGPVTTAFCDLTGLTPGSTYTFLVTANNGSGSVPAATATAGVKPDKPAAPTAVTVALGVTPGVVTVGWATPTGGLSTGFTVTATPTPSGTAVLCQAAAGDNSCVFSGPTALTPTLSYLFVVTATNLAGSSDSGAIAAVTPDAPGAPTAVTVTLGASPGDLTVGWTTPSGGVATGFTVTPSPQVAGVPAACLAGPGATTCAFTGLNPAVSYSFVVTATNTSGSNSSTATGAVVPGAPGAPTNVTVGLSPGLPGYMYVTWGVPTSGGAVTDYTVTTTTTNGATLPAVCTVTTGTRACSYNLAPTGSFVFVVRANGASGGTNAAATTPVVPNTPNAPTAVAVALGADAPGTATVTWSPPIGGGTPTSYGVLATPVTGTPPLPCTVVPPAALSCTFTGLDTATLYTFVVYAIGAGITPATGISVVLDKPGAPTATSLVFGAAGAVTVNWAVPAGGGAVTSYQVTRSPTTGGGTLSCLALPSSARSCAFTGLDPAAAYTFTVRAIGASGFTDAAGLGPVVANPPGVPGTPTVQVIGISTARVSWTAPSPAAGPITGYTVTAFADNAPSTPITSVLCPSVGVLDPLTCVFGGLLQNRTYTFKVTANGTAGSTDSAGLSDQISTADPIAQGSPVVALAGPNAVRVSWVAAGGGTVTGYTVTSDPALTAPASCTNTLLLTCVFDHLASGTSYKFTVSAIGVSTTTVPSAESLAIIPGPPDAPAKPTVTQTGNGTSVRVTWVAPAEGAGIDGYTVESNPAGHGCQPLVRIPDPTTCLVTGLTEGDSYAFRVQAIGEEGGGDSPFSPYSDVIVVGSPGSPSAPGQPTAAVTGLGQVSVTWNIPAGGGVITDYSVRTVQPMPATARQCADHILAPPCLFTGLNPGVSYTFLVTAYGPGGDPTTSLASNAVRATRPGTPGTPTVVLSRPAADTIATVSWTAPTTGGPITSYQVTVTPPLETETIPLVCGDDPAVRTCVFTGLEPTVTYTFHVEAVGPAGFSAHAADSVPVQAAAPGPPGLPTVVVTDDDPLTVTVSWTAPIGGGTFTRYRLDTNVPTADTVACGLDPAVLTCVLTDLVLGNPYQFTVVAVGPLTTTDSDVSDVVYLTAAGQPGTPTVANGATGSVLVSWAAPTAGGPVTDYTVVSTPGSAGPTGCSHVTGLSCLYTGLNPARSYTFVVYANGPLGEPTGSSPSTAATAGPPAAPGTPAVQVTAPGTVAVSWTPTSGGGPFDNYSVTSDPAVTAPPLCTDTSLTSCVFTGLNPATSYTFLVTANGLVSDTPSVARSRAIMPGSPGAPGTPTVQLTAQNAVRLSWTASSGGGPLTAYTVITNPGAAAVGCIAVTALTCDLTGLATDAYTFLVSAYGPGGNSVSGTSASLSTGTPGAPGVPTVLVTAPGSVQVSWGAAASGSVSNYTVTSVPALTSPPSACIQITGLTCTFTGLSPTTAYTFLVTANGPAGNTPSVDPSVSVKPAAPAAPNSPTVLVTAPNTVRVSWSASSGGGPLTNYTVTSVPALGSPPVACFQITALTCDFTGLSAATSYTFVVTANGPAGPAASTPSASISPASPAAPGTPSVSVVNTTTVHVTWAASAGGTPVTDYTVTSSPVVAPSGACLSTSNLACDFGGLEPTQSYTFLVTANGAAGGTPSAARSVPIITGAPGIPGTPTVVTTVAGTVHVSWTAPAIPAGPVSGYTVSSNPIETAPGGCTNTLNLSCDFSGLGSASHTFLVTANGSAGDTASAASSVSIIAAAPTAPIAPTVALSGPNAVQVTWLAPAGGPVTDYSVTSTPAVTPPAGCTTVTVLTCVFNGLTGGTSYTFQVAAAGPVGTPGLSLASASIVAGPPAAPAKPAATVGSTATSATVSWAAPSGTAGIVGYTVQSNPGNFGCAVAAGASAISCSVTGLTAGAAYTFQVRANGTTGGGNSAFSPASDSVTAGAAPGTPTGVTATPSGMASITVAFTPNGVGSAARNFTATASPGGYTCTTATGTTSTCVISGLTAGTTYTVTVVANGTAGNSAASQASLPAMAQTFLAPTLPADAPTGSVVAGPVTSSAGTTLTPNATTTISGASFAPYTGISVGIYPGPVLLHTAVTDSTGAFSVSVTLPGVSLGAHAIVAAGLRSTGAVRYRSSDVTITAGPLARNAASGSAGEVAHRLPASRLPSRVLVSRADR